MNQTAYYQAMTRDTAEAAAVLGFGMIPLIIGLVIIGLFATYIARRKGYSGKIIIWAWLPFLNIYGLLMFVGLPDLVLHGKMDRLLGSGQRHADATAQNFPPSEGPRP